jgi:hypothetical protein
VGGCLRICQPCRRRPPLGNHELMRHLSNDVRIALCSVSASSASVSVGRPA